MENTFIFNFSIMDFTLDEHDFEICCLSRRKDLINYIDISSHSEYRIKFVERPWDSMRLKLELNRLEVKPDQFFWKDKIYSKDEVWKLANSKKPFDLVLVVKAEEEEDSNGKNNW